MVRDPTLLGQIQRSFYDTHLREDTRDYITTGTIISFDETSWTAAVEIVDPIGNREEIIDNVMIPHKCNGVKERVPRPGDFVIIAFSNQQIFQPYIVDIYPSSTNPPVAESSYSSDVSGLTSYE